MKFPAAKVYAVRGNRGLVARIRIRRATLDDLDLLVRHRRRMWEEIADFRGEDLDAADRAYRRWARSRLKSGRLVGFLAETARREVVSSACLWLSPVQPAPAWNGTLAPYLLSMYTEPEHRGKGYATRIVRTAIAWSRERGYNFLLLHASRHGRSIYAKEGFRRTWEMRLNLDSPRGSSPTKRLEDRSQRPRRRG